MYNYFEFSCEITLIVISDCISECRLRLTLNTPSDFISLTGCIIEGLISIFSFSLKIFDISVGFTDPYNSLFSVLNLLILNSLPCIFSCIVLAVFFRS